MVDHIIFRIVRDQNVTHSNVRGTTAQYIYAVGESSRVYIAYPHLACAVEGADGGPQHLDWIAAHDGVVSVDQHMTTLQIAVEGPHQVYCEVPIEFCLGKAIVYTHHRVYDVVVGQKGDRRVFLVLRILDEIAHNRRITLQGLRKVKGGLQEGPHLVLLQLQSVQQLVMALD